MSTTTISSLASLLSAGTTSASAATPSWATIRNGVLSSVAGVMGITQSDLTAQLKTGKSMAQIAKANGVSTDALTTTIKSALAQDNLPSAINLEIMAGRMAENTNNASIEDPVTPVAAPTSASATTSGHGIDTSAVDSTNIGGLSLSSNEISTLLGTTVGNSLDMYL